MKDLTRRISRSAAILVAVAATTSCIDEDLSSCPVPQTAADVEVLYTLQYNAGDAGFADDGDISSLHLGFWDEPSHLYQERVLDGDALPADRTFRVTLPPANYAHVAMSGCQSQIDGTHTPMPQVVAGVLLSQPEARPDTLDVMTVPSYTGTLEMDLTTLTEGVRHFEVDLWPRVGRVIVTVTHPDDMTNTRCYVSGDRDGYYPWTGDWRDNDGLVTDMTPRRDEPDAGTTAFDGYLWPTASAPDGKGARQVTDGGDGWNVYLYTDYGSKVVMHRFNISAPVETGRVLNVDFNIDHGTGTSEMGTLVEIDTDWRPGNDYEVDM